VNKKVVIIWLDGTHEGTVSVRNGTLSTLETISESGKVNGATFSFQAKGECRLSVEVEDPMLEAGAGSTIVHVKTEKNPFSFFLRDISVEYPVYIPEYGVIVTEDSDTRSYLEISGEIESRATLSKLEAMEIEPEESFENAAKDTRDLPCVTWLGLSRDIRIFEAGFRAITFDGPGREVWDWIKPKYHGKDVRLPELNNSPVRYNYFTGRGIGCVQALERWIEEGTLPILNVRHIDDDVCYLSKIFVTNEKRPLTMENIHGTHILVADEYSFGSMLTEEQKKIKDTLLENEIEQEEETVIYMKIEAINMAKAPRYSWVRIPEPNVHTIPDVKPTVSVYNGDKGYGTFAKDRVYLIATINGKPVPQQEMAVLLKPGEKVEYIFKIPHRPIPEERADALAGQDYDLRLQECIGFWKDKLADAAKISVPEKRIDEMMKAGILHLDLICYGNEPDGPVAPTIGVYSPIGSESSPIIQYLESVGKNDLARRAIMYFIEKQHDDGFMQNFGGYMLETGAVLWNIGEHYRYTGDIEWIKLIRGNIIKACDYLIAWREKNKREELRGNGYGMIDGKVADPEDPYHSYMLNGFAYLGLSRAAEVLKEIEPEVAERISSEAKALKADIRAALEKSIAECPVIPLGNGHWCPSVSPWTENIGPVSIYAEPGQWFTHATVTTRDAICGSMYLLLQEVVEPNELYGDFILKSFTELFYLRNVVFSQPYYSPHPYANLKRGEVKAFLKEYYNNVSSLADRETYTFWEHYHHASPHKTHEEGWFLMRSRWMLYMEEGETLNLLPGIPRAWLEDGKMISICGMQSYFGPLSFEVQSSVSTGKVKVSVRIDASPERLPARIRVRIPHPQMLKAAETSAGEYCPRSETVIIDNFSGSACFTVTF
jgi:hypothetical protein